jgi:uncharacterized phage protein (TIGR02218 family)
MRVLPAGLQAHLDAGVTTLCHCWRLTLASGETLGFTDHDRALTFDGTVFEAQAGFTGSEIESSLGLSVDNLEATGALESGRLDGTRIRNGDFDHATLELWRVNWSDVTQRLLMRKGHLGEVTYGSGVFTAEVRGLAHMLNQPRGRLYQFGCDADLGDVRCGVNTTLASFRGTGTVSQIDGETITLNGLSFSDDWFTRGKATWLTGLGAGKTLGIRRHRNVAGIARISFWQKPAFAIAIGNQVQVTAGCDKQFSTCKAKFNNATNFRGFPQMPGNDFVTAFPLAGDAANDGSRRS